MNNKELIKTAGLIIGAGLALNYLIKNTMMGRSKYNFGNFPEYPTSSSLINVNGEALKNVGAGHNHGDAYQQEHLGNLPAHGFYKGMVGK